MTSRPQINNGPVDDPRASELSSAASGANPVEVIFGADGLLTSAWVPSEADRLAFVVRLADTATPGSWWQS